MSVRLFSMFVCSSCVSSASVLCLSVHPLSVARLFSLSRLCVSNAPVLFVRPVSVARLFSLFVRPVSVARLFSLLSLIHI